MDNKKQILTNLGAFLQRVQLAGAEVPAFVEIMNWLAEQQNGESKDSSKPDNGG